MDKKKDLRWCYYTLKTRYIIPLTKLNKFKIASVTVGASTSNQFQNI